MNKKGAGLRVELIFLLVFLICLLIATIGLHRMGLLGGDAGIYSDNGYIEDAINYDYNSLEQKVTDAASQYYEDVYSNHNDDTLVINTYKLKSSGYMSGIFDSRGKECKGYAIVMKNKNIVSYIKCSVYKTTGYNEDYE